MWVTDAGEAFAVDKNTGIDRNVVGLTVIELTVQIDRGGIAGNDHRKIVEQVGSPVIGHGSPDDTFARIGIREIDGIDQRAVRLEYAGDAGRSYLRRLVERD